jgi:hypothetical protein
MNNQADKSNDIISQESLDEDGEEGKDPVQESLDRKMIKIAMKKRK